MKFVVARTFKGHNVLFRMPVSTAIVLFWVHEGMTFLLLSTAANAFCCPLVLGFWGTTEQETGVSAPCWVANVLLSARDRRIWRNGHLFVCKSPLQKPKLVRQLLQSQIANLLNCMHLC